MLLAPLVASCAGGLSDQIVVQRDFDPYNLAAAQHEADQVCAARGGRHARFVMWQNNAGGIGQRSSLPNAIYDCVPAASTAAPVAQTSTEATAAR